MENYIHYLNFVEEKLNKFLILKNLLFAVKRGVVNVVEMLYFHIQQLK